MEKGARWNGESSVIHTDFGQNVPEIPLDRNPLSIYSLILTFVDVYNKDVEVELN